MGLIMQLEVWLNDALVGYFGLIRILGQETAGTH